MGAKNKDDRDCIARKLLGEQGANLIAAGHHVGLGTGSTAAEFIKALAKRVQSGLHVKAFSSSIKSTALATSLGICCRPLFEASSLDIAVDGADQISAQGLMIKGRGGALLREKIMAMMSKRHVILATWAKFSPPFGVHPLPLEIFPMAWPYLKKALSVFGNFCLRQQDGQVYVTDNGNFIVDLTLSDMKVNWRELHKNLKSICGVLETGIFCETSPEFYMIQPTLKIIRWQRDPIIAPN